MSAERIDRARLAAGTRELTRRDKRLADIVHRYGPPPLWARRPGFATLVLIILEQQVTLASGRAAFERLERAAGAVTAERVAACSEAQLRRAGLTRQKARYCRELARAVLEGRFSFRRVARANDEDAREGLCALLGVGRWTADVYLLFALRRPDIWPVGDLALDKALAELEGSETRLSPERVGEITSRWSPWRSVAARILWHFYLSSRGRQA